MKRFIFKYSESTNALLDHTAFNFKAKEKTVAQRFIRKYI